MQISVLLVSYQENMLRGNNFRKKLYLAVYLYFCFYVIDNYSSIKLLNYDQTNFLHESINKILDIMYENI